MERRCQMHRPRGPCRLHSCQPGRGQGRGSSRGARHGCHCWYKNCHAPNNKHSQSQGPIEELAGGFCNSEMATSQKSGPAPQDWWSRTRRALSVGREQKKASPNLGHPFFYGEGATRWISQNYVAGPNSIPMFSTKLPSVVDLQTFCSKSSKHRHENHHYSYEIESRLRYGKFTHQRSSFKIRWYSSAFGPPPPLHMPSVICNKCLHSLLLLQPWQTPTKIKMNLLGRNNVLLHWKWLPAFLLVWGKEIPKQCVS